MRSHLMLLRVWPEALGDGAVEWRGRMQSLTTGEVRYFRDEKTMFAAMLRIIQSLDELGADLNIDQSDESGGGPERMDGETLE